MPFTYLLDKMYMKMEVFVSEPHNLLLSNLGIETYSSKKSSEITTN